MMAKKVKAPPGLDYDPVVGAYPNLSFGVAQAGGEHQLTATRFIGKRLFPVARPDDLDAAWPTPTCFRVDTLLPAAASSELWDVRRLCEAYDAQGFRGLRDLVVIVTARFPEVDESAAPLTLHYAWEQARSFGSMLVARYDAPVVQVMHVPARAGRPGDAHVHLMMLARQLLPSGFGKFVRPLLDEDGRERIDEAWAQFESGA